jgi:hypothetical protein
LNRLIDFAILTEKEIAEQKYYADIINKNNNKSKKLRLIGEQI